MNGPSVDEMRPYLVHLPFCKFTVALQVADDPTAAAAGQCDCGFDQLLDRIDAMALPPCPHQHFHRGACPPDAESEA